MRRPRHKLLAGGSVIALALAYLIYTGVTQSAVYFVTPAELLAAPAAGKAYRLGGLVAPGSLAWTPTTLDLSLALTDGKSTVPVRPVGHWVVPRALPPAALRRGAVRQAEHTKEGSYRFGRRLGGDLPSRPSPRRVQ